MGLDMYLTGHYFIWSKDQDNIEIKGIDLHGFKLKNLEIELGYWRKANHIHKWFVDNIQEGVDECQESYVSKDDLKKLLSHCKKVLKGSKTAEELLPTQSGFFFGNTAYNESYFNNIKYTIKIIKKVLRLPKGWSIYYNSSW